MKFSKFIEKSKKLVNSAVDDIKTNTETLNEKYQIEDKVKVGIDKTKTTIKQTAEKASDTLSDVKKTIKESELEEKVKDGVELGKSFVEGTYEATTETVAGTYRNWKYSKNELDTLQKDIENQGGHYRELNKNAYLIPETIILAGETLATYIQDPSIIPEEIIRSYQAQYPVEAAEISFIDKVQSLDSEQLTGFISGIKGKLFELKYVDYLNDDNLPDGYSAAISERANEPGWDIAITGPDGDIASVIQAKATDSVSYVKDAIEKYPNIDIVTTDEVYSHLVMTGVGESVINSSISNEQLADSIVDSIDATEMTMEFLPPVFTLAFIAFTSYKELTFRSSF